jgi:hypothetical protein
MKNRERGGGGGVKAEKWKYPSTKKNSWHQHTVDGDGDDLGQSEAIGTLEGGDLAKLAWVLTSSKSRSLCLAATRTAMVRPLSCRESQVRRRNNRKVPQD